MGRRKQHYFYEKEFKNWMKEPKKYEKQIVEKIYLIIGAVINRNHFFLPAGEEDLRQHAIENILKGLKRYKPESGTYFNYITKIARLSMINLIERFNKRKYQNSVNIESLSESLEAPPIPVFLIENIEERINKFTNSLVAPSFINYMRGDSSPSLTDFKIYALREGWDEDQINKFIGEVKRGLKAGG